MSQPSQAGSGTDERFLLAQRARQFLVHSFLYYRLGEPVIPDEDFDRIAAELNALHEAHPDWPLPHAEVLGPALGPEGSGFSIRAYPPQIVTTAFKLLYAHTAPEIGFAEFVEHRGYALEGEGARA